MRFLLVLTTLCLSLSAQVVDIDLGSAPLDIYCEGGKAATVVTPGATGDTTLRFGTYKCNLPAPKGLYVVELYFRETGTVSTIGKRIFSVKINDQPVLDKFDLFASHGLAPTSREYVISSTGIITVAFSFTSQSAVCSRIISRPLTLGGLVQFKRYFGYVPQRQQDGIYILTPATNDVVVDVAVWRNGIRVKEGFDYRIGEVLITPNPVYIPIVPIGIWAADDTILCDFSQVDQRLILQPAFPISPDTARRWITK